MTTSLCGNRPTQPRPQRGTWCPPRSRWRQFAAAAFATIAAPSLGQPDPPVEETGAISLLQTAETAIVEAIARCEQSVVAISRSPRPIRVVDGQAIPAAAGGNAAALRIQNQRRLPGALGALQTAPVMALPTVGAGVLIDPAGLILTQYDVVKLGQHHAVTLTGGRTLAATIRAADPRSGLAILVATDLRDGQPDLPEALPLGEAELLRKGRFVVAIGNPQAVRSDGQATASWGSVTNTAAKAPRSEDLNGRPIDGAFRTTLHHFGSLIQTDARLGWGAGGGALVTLDGRLVGITTTAAAIAGHEHAAGYAIPINAAMRRVIATLAEGREPEYGLLGVSFEGMPSRSTTNGEVGIGVRAAFVGGPAAAAGLRRGDLVLSVGGTATTSADALQLAVGSLPPGTEASVRFVRNGQERETPVRLGKAYIERGQIVTRRRQPWRGIRVDYATAVPGEVLQAKAARQHLDPKGCVVITEVERDSVSWNQGIRPYAYISHVAGARVTSPDEFYEAVQTAEDPIRLTFTQPPSGAAEAAEAG